MQAWCNPEERSWTPSHQDSTHQPKWVAAIFPMKVSARHLTSRIYKLLIEIAAWYPFQIFGSLQNIQIATTYKEGSTMIGEIISILEARKEMWDALEQMEEFFPFFYRTEGCLISIIIFRFSNKNIIFFFPFFLFLLFFYWLFYMTSSLYRFWKKKQWLCRLWIIILFRFTQKQQTHTFA